MPFEIIKNGNPEKGADDGTKKAILITAIAVTAQAKELAPKDRLRLTNSLMWQVQGKDGGFNDNPGEKAPAKIGLSPREFEGYVGSALAYAVYQEMGTRYIGAQPYLRPAVLITQAQKLKQEVKKEQVDEMRKTLGLGKKFARFG